MEVTREIVFPDSPDEVWKALTEAEQLEEWFANDVELDPREGGDGVFRWDDGEERRAKVLVVEPAMTVAPQRHSKGGAAQNGKQHRPAHIRIHDLSLQQCCDASSVIEWASCARPAPFADA